MPYSNLTIATGPVGLVGTRLRLRKEGVQREMGLAMSTRRELIEELARWYWRASRKKKGVILDEFVQTTGYQRKYAIQLLNWWGAAAWCGSTASW